MDKTDTKFWVCDIKHSLFTKESYETYIFTKLKEDMKTKMIICENQVE